MRTNVLHPFAILFLLAFCVCCSEAPKTQPESAKSAAAKASEAPAAQVTFYDLLAHGKLDLLKQSFGDNPVETKPERTMTLWSYPDKGIQFVHIRQDNTASFTFKLVPPKS